MIRATSGRWAAEEPLAYFARRYEPDVNSGCWLWSAGYTGNGYGAAGMVGYSRGAHRASWQLHVGPIPAGMMILHRCDTPACVNPDHLFLGTHADNMADCSRKGRICTAPGGLAGLGTLRPRAPATACPKGHPMSGDNLFVGVGGKRACLACRTVRNRRSKLARKARLAAHKREAS